MSAYFDRLLPLLAHVQAANADALARAASRIADSLAAGGVLHAFGSGHSHALAEELFHRAGGLAPVNALLDARLMLHEGTMAATLAERLPGYAEAVLARYDLRPGEVLLVISNSGRNAVPIEMALGAQRRGLFVVALTSVAHSSSQPARHASGQRLFEIADVVLDNGGEIGDAALTLPGLPDRLCATSTVVGAALVQALVYAVAQQLQARGITPPILRSSNVGGEDSDAYNDRLLAPYRARITHG